MDPVSKEFDMKKFINSVEGYEEIVKIKLIICLKLINLI